MWVGKENMFTILFHVNNLLIVSFYIFQKHVAPKKDDTVNYIEVLKKLEKMDDEPFGMSSIELDIEALRKEAALLTRKNREIWVRKDAETKKSKRPLVCIH